MSLTERRGAAWPGAAGRGGARQGPAGQGKAGSTTPDHPSIEDLCRQHPDESDRAIAEKFYANASVGEIVGIIANEVARVRRASARLVEAREGPRVFLRRPSTREPDGGVLTLRPLPDFAPVDFAAKWSTRLRRQRVRLGTGAPPVLMGQMDLDQHQARLCMLRAHRRGIDRTVYLHEEALKDLRRSGCRNLDELAAAMASEVVQS